MSLDPGPIGRAAAELMERVEAQHPDAELRDVIVIAEVNCGEYTAFRWQGSSERPSINAGLCAQALSGLTEGERQQPSD